MLCRLKEGLFRQSGLTMIMFHGDPLTSRFTEGIDRVVETGLYNYSIFLRMHFIKFFSRNTAIVHPLNGYYSFNLYHMQPAFYLLLMGWCLSTLCPRNTLQKRTEQKKLNLIKRCFVISNMASITDYYVTHNTPKESLSQW